MKSKVLVFLISFVFAFARISSSIGDVSSWTFSKDLLLCATEERKIKHKKKR